MFGNPNQLFRQETSKPKKSGETLRRFSKYLLPWWPALLLAAVFIIIATWAQVTNPELTGELVDCYLTQTATSAFGGAALPGAADSAAQTNCWLSEGKEPQGLTQQLIKSAFLSGGFKAPSDPLTQDERVAGLVRLILFMVVLYVLGSVLTGLTFFSVTWAGQHVLRDLRLRVFEQFHRLHMGFYAEHEAGDLMSRITNDTETIGQALNFALVNVISGALLLVWIAYNMIAKSLPLRPTEHGSGPGDGSGDTVFLFAGAQGLPAHAPIHRQRQRRAAREHLGGARSAGL